MSGLGPAPSAQTRQGKRLVDQSCVVTGASSGIGRAIALALAAAGARVCAVARRRDALEATADQVRDSGSITPYPTDLSSDESIAALVKTLGRHPGGLDVLVHSAGTISIGALETSPVAELDRQHSTNVRAPYLLTQALLPLLRANRGQIVFINSTAVQSARAEMSQYTSTKQALRAIADSLREEVNAEGIRVTRIYPGRTGTPMQSTVHVQEGRPYVPDRLLQPEDIAELVVGVLTLPRTAEVTDVSLRPMRKP